MPYAFLYDTHKANWRLVEDCSEPPEPLEEHTCSECVYWEQPPDGNWGICSKDNAIDWVHAEEDSSWCGSWEEYESKN